MDITDSEEELFLAQNSFSQDILQPNFSLGSIFDPAVGSDEPAPRNSCAEELSKIVSEGFQFVGTSKVKLSYFCNSFK